MRRWRMMFQTDQRRSFFCNCERKITIDNDPCQSDDKWKNEILCQNELTRRSNPERRKRIVGDYQGARSPWEIPIWVGWKVGIGSRERLIDKEGPAATGIPGTRLIVIGARNEKWSRSYYAYTPAISPSRWAIWSILIVIHATTTSRSRIWRSHPRSVYKAALLLLTRTFSKMAYQDHWAVWQWRNVRSRQSKG